MAEKSTVARPYAKAVFELALEHKALQMWSEVLETARAVVSDERVARLLGSPRTTPQELADLLIGIVATALGRQDLDAHVKNFIRLLAANRRLGHLPEIAERFRELRAEHERVVDVQVTSAVPLTEEQKQQYAAALRQRLQREVRLHCAVDPALLGGAVLQADDLVIDGSLRGQLERLRSQVAA